MKQSFQILGILTLLVGSFWYSNEVDTVAKLSDDLLNEIKSKSIDYKEKPINPIITKDTIIPGLNGKEVDVNESYNYMREIGYFNEKLLKYKKIKVSSELYNNKDKYIISGCQEKKSVALLFKVDNVRSLKKITRALMDENVKGTFFIESDFLENNMIPVISLINKHHTVGNLSKNEDYTHPDFGWMQTIIVNTGGQKDNYCYTEKPNLKTLNACAKKDSYTIIPTKVIKDKPYINVKKNLKNGALIAFESGNSLNNEIDIVLKYIKSRGYKIVSLEKELQE